MVDFEVLVVFPKNVRGRSKKSAALVLVRCMAFCGAQKTNLLTAKRCARQQHCNILTESKYLTVSGVSLDGVTSPV